MTSPYLALPPVSRDTMIERKLQELAARAAELAALAAVPQTRHATLIFLARRIGDAGTDLDALLGPRDGGDGFNPHGSGPEPIMPREVRG